MEKRVRKTSIDCYNQIKAEGLLSKRRFQVYEILFNNGPCTGTEVSMIFKKRYVSTNHSEGVRNRITELFDRGVVYEFGTKKCQYTNKTVTVWDVNSRLPVNPKKKEKQVKYISIVEAEQVLNKSKDFHFIIRRQGLDNQLNLL